MATKMSLIGYWIVIEWPLNDTWIDHWKVIKKNSGWKVSERSM